MSRSGLHWLLILAAALPAGAYAETSAKDLAIATRALGFLEPRLAGSIPVAIVYADGDDASMADARQIRTGFANSAIKGVAFQPRLVAASDLGGMAGARIIFLAAGAGNQAAIAATAARTHAVTVSSGMACVKAGRCALGVRAEPSVEIVVSRAAANAAQVKFSQAFLMLVKEQ